VSSDLRRTARRRRALVGLIAATCSVASSACAGGAPLLHPAHVLRPGEVSIGAGVSGQFKNLTNPTAKNGDTSSALLDSVAVAPGVAPWVSGRVGIVHDFEGGITYTGREIRIDGRHAWNFGPFALSAGLGATALVPKPLPGDSGSVYGGGADLPVIFGWSSTADLYSIWFGPRAGFEFLKGQVLESQFEPSGSATTFAPVSGHHIYVGGLVGFRVGFRYFHAALELSVAYHTSGGTIGPDDVTARDVSIAPAAGLVLSF